MAASKRTVDHAENRGLIGGDGWLTARRQTEERERPPTSSPRPTTASSRGELDQLIDDPEPLAAVLVAPVRVGRLRIRTSRLR